MAEPAPDWADAAGQGGPPAPPRDAMPVLSVAGFEGPLDFLLEMVRRHRVDLGPLSIVALTDQLLTAIAAGAHHFPLERRSAWLIAASDLVLLKARLLCPADTARRLRQRAALASTLVVSLELARDASLEMDQDKAFGPITLRSSWPGRMIGQDSAA